MTKPTLPTGERCSSEADAEAMQRQIERLTDITRKLDEEARDLYMVYQVSKSLSGNDPAKVCEALASTMADRLSATKAIALIHEDNSAVFRPKYTQAIPPYLVNKIAYTPRQGILWQMVKAGDPFSVVDYSGRPLYEGDFAASGLGGLELVQWVPLINKDNDDVVGIFAFDRGAETTSQVHFLEMLAAQGARALQNAMLYQQIEISKSALTRQIKKLEMLYDVGRALSIIDNRNFLLTEILGHAAAIAKAEKGSIMLFDDSTGELVVQVVKGVGAEIEQKIIKGEITTKRLKRGEGIAGKVAQTGRPIVVNNVEEASTGFVKAKTTRVSSILCVPLEVHKDVIGVLNITNKSAGEEFTDDDLQIIQQVADQAAVAIHNARLYELAVTDGLTKVYIRRHLFQRLAEEMKRAQRYSMPITLLMVDIDFFKSVNDRYGHPCGDRVLTEVARVLRMSVREIDLIGRYGGEEFCVVLPSTTIEGGLTVAYRMHALLEELDIECEGSPVRVSVSGGLANFPEHVDNMSDLIKFADAALYHSKRTGRNKTTVFSPQVLQLNLPQT